MQVDVYHNDRNHKITLPWSSPSLQSHHLPVHRHRHHLVSSNDNILVDNNNSNKNCVVLVNNNEESKEDPNIVCVLPPLPPAWKRDFSIMRQILDHPLSFEHVFDNDDMLVLLKSPQDTKKATNWDIAITEPTPQQQQQEQQQVEDNGLLTATTATTSSPTTTSTSPTVRTSQQVAELLTQTADGESDDDDNVVFCDDALTDMVATALDVHAAEDAAINNSVDVPQDEQEEDFSNTTESNKVGTSPTPLYEISDKSTNQSDAAARNRHGKERSYAEGGGGSSNQNHHGRKNHTKRSNSVADFRPYGNLFGGGGGRDLSMERQQREDREMQRLVSLAKMHCATRSFHYHHQHQPPPNHMQYIHHLGLFYASQPILTTNAAKSSHEVNKRQPQQQQRSATTTGSRSHSKNPPIPMYKPDIAMKRPRGSVVQASTTSGRHKLLARRFPWLLHFPSPRVFGQVAHHEVATTFDDDDDDEAEPHFDSSMRMVEHEPVVYRIMI